MVAAPSRQQNHPGRATSCPHCGCEMASARHLWAECPHYDDYKAILQAQYDIEAGWWARQPRVTAKSGWVTYDAAANPSGRVKKLIAKN